MKEVITMKAKGSRFIELECVMRRKHLTQKDLASVLNKESVGVISNRFLGKSHWQLDEMYAVLDFLGIPKSEIFTYFPPKEG